MNRRDFCKLFGATAATASASTLLAGIPEAEPKIQLLDEKKITEPHEIAEISSIIRYTVRVNNNIRASGPVFGSSGAEFGKLAFGRYRVDVEMEAYLTAEMMRTMGNYWHSAVRIKFPILSPLSTGVETFEFEETLFKIQHLSLHTSDPQSFTLADIQAVGIYHHKG